MSVRVKHKCWKCPSLRAYFVMMTLNTTSDDKKYTVWLAVVSSKRNNHNFLLGSFIYICFLKLHRVGPSGPRYRRPSDPENMRWDTVQEHSMQHQLMSSGGWRMHSNILCLLHLTLIRWTYDNKHTQRLNLATRFIYSSVILNLILDITTHVASDFMGPTSGYTTIIYCGIFPS